MQWQLQITKQCSLIASDKVAKRPICSVLKCGQPIVITLFSVEVSSTCDGVGGSSSGAFGMHAATLPRDVNGNT